MSKFKKKGLGKGLSALFGDTSPEPSENRANSQVNTAQKTCLIGDLNRNPYQPRIKFDEEKINELSNSIKQNGLIQPIAVRVDKTDPGKYEIVAGERRWMAAQRAGLHQVPIVVLELNDNETLEVAIVENIQRENLNSIEEAKGYERLNKEFGYDHDKIAKFISKSRSHVSNTLRLLSLPNDIISMLEEGQLTAGQARPLIGLPKASEIAEDIVKKRLTSRQVESLSKNKKRPFKLNQQVDSNIEEIQKLIENRLGLKVNIVNRKNNSGKIVVEYKNIDQFELVSKLLRQN
ncbi:MAG: chromosome partitioning protein ParB [Pelagibacteraceae bacterium TMED287]|nr:MAG: chromosome partitioning protein ParB [Pelagibacteraceae bacterium TMED287]|tara:strand:- start:44 stop:916 length:873 start_codon:yes stop_codon:yes gene_type:complete